jgi:threonine/homoserine/homoserine lactone efflux protein
VWLASRARRWLQRPRAALWINRVAGSVFIGFGLVLAGLRRTPA